MKYMVITRIFITQRTLLDPQGGREGTDMNISYLTMDRTVQI